MDTQFEEMRQQMAILKGKLDRQEIVNDRLIRQSMKNNASSILNKYLVSIIAALFVIPYSYYVFINMMGFSMAFWICTCIFMVVCLGFTLFVGKKVYDSNMMDNNLLEVQQNIAKAKKLDSDWLLFAIPVLILWVGWLIYEAYSVLGETLLPFLIGAVLGLIIGGAIGLKMHFKTQRQYQEILQHIEEIRA